MTKKTADDKADKLTKYSLQIARAVVGSGFDC